MSLLESIFAVIFFICCQLYLVLYIFHFLAVVSLFLFVELGLFWFFFFVIKYELFFGQYILDLDQGAKKWNIIILKSNILFTNWKIMNTARLFSLHVIWSTLRRNCTQWVAQKCRIMSSFLFFYEWIVYKSEAIKYSQIYSKNIGFSH